MPTIQGLLRRRGPASDADNRRHSFFAGDPTASDTLAVRTSNQLHRKTSASSFLSPPSNASMPAINEPSEEPANRSVSPPVQEESSKHRRFSMLKFRHASDSQLSTRARQQADASPVPPLPKRRFILLFCGAKADSLDHSTRDYYHCTDDGG
jgi:hypothetical protein